MLRLQITSREYKVMLAAEPFADRKAGIRSLEHALQPLAGALGLKVSGSLELAEKRTICFLDTADGALLNNHLILRYRQPAATPSAGTLTLKCRTGDRYLTAGQDLTVGPGLKGKSKFEEDIGPPFCSRFSRSTTVACRADDVPRDLEVAASWFPRLAAVCKEGEPALLEVVGREVPHERVYEGLQIHLDDAVAASVAIILWTQKWKGDFWCGELSFRYGSPEEKYSLETATAAYRLFGKLQQQAWALPQAASKTQLAYSA